MSGSTVLQNFIDIKPNEGLDHEGKSSAETFQLRPQNIFKKLITREEAESLIKHAVSVDVELVDYYLQPYSEEKLGFLASHQRLVVIFKRPGCNENKRRNFFVKAIPYDNPSQVSYIQEKDCFAKEANFYKFLVPLLTENYKGEQWAPRCYLAKENVLVFEDMMFKGFSTRSKVFNDESIKSAVSCLARFHACSLLAEHRLNGKRLNELYPEIFKESEYKKEGRSIEWFTTAINLAISVANDLGLDTTAIRQTSEVAFDMAHPSKNKRNVASHGDLWSSNIMFDAADHCNLIDFQLVRYAPLAHDLMQLLHLTTSREFREENEKKLIERYYAALKETLIDNNCAEIVPPYEEVLQGVEEQRYPGLITATINFPTIMMDGKIGARIMNKLEAYETYFFRDRKPVVDEIMALDSEYERKVKEIVKELTEMSFKAASLPRPS